MKSRRNLSLDVLRIIAALMVLCVHAGQNTHTFNQYTDVGAKGVQLFFVLSGFLAFQSYDTIVLNGGNYWTYYKNRIKRIIPIYWVVLILIYFYDLRHYVLSGMSIGQALSYPDGPNCISFLRYFFCLQYILPSRNFNLWNNRYALWTMSEFAFFYLCIPVIYKFFHGKGRMLLATIAMIFISAPVRGFFVKLYESYNGGQMVAGGVPVAELYCFMLGILVWEFRETPVLFGLCSVGLLMATLSKFEYYGYEFVFAAMLALLSQFNLSDYLPPSMTRILIMMSNWSFCLYLCHPVIFRIILRKMTSYNLIWTDLQKFLILLIGSLVGTIVFYSIYEFARKGIVRLAHGISG